MMMDQNRNTPAALPELPQGVRSSPCRARRFASCALVVLSSFLCAGALADNADDAEQLLKQADAAKLADYARFSQLLQSLQALSAVRPGPLQGDQ